jgi:beta-glucosidase
MKKLFTLCLTVFLLGSCQNTVNNEFKIEAAFQPFKPPIPYETAMAKADSILQQMSLEEKISMIGGNNVFFTKGYDKYDIPSLRFSDATQGISLVDFKDHLEKSVAFPAPILLTSTWNTELAREYARSIGEECRAGGIAVLLGPGMNMYRISQCGRNFEYFGEDPFLTARMIENYVVGLQNTGTIATLKHFIANNSDFRRRTSNSVVSERALHEIYMPAFEAGINAGAMAVMTSYNQVNGVYAAQSQYVISKLLRQDLGFKWLVISDWLSIWDAEKALKSGLDLDMPGETEDGIYSEDDPEEYLRREAPKLIKEGKVKEADIDRMVRNILVTIFAMGSKTHTIKENSYLENYNKHIEAALETAREGMVLLKNDNQTLPFQAKKEDVILVSGEYVDKLAVGSGAAFVDGYDSVTMLDALKEQFGENVTHIENPTDEEITNASLVMYSAGTKDSEGSDISFDIPTEINSTIRRMANLNAKTVVVMYAGGGRNMSSWHNKVAAILYGWYPGQVGNTAVAEIIAGVTNPSGKLPITIERDFKNSPGYPYLPEGEELYTGWDYDFDMDYPVYDINYKESIFTGYRWYENKKIQPLYAFGHGLSYSTFEYSNLKTNAETYSIDDDVLVKVDVTNTSDVDGKEIVQLYVTDLEASVERPPKELKDFRKVNLKAGEKRTVYFRLQQRDFAFWDEKTASWKVEPGKFEIMIGAASDNINQKVGISIL